MPTFRHRIPIIHSYSWKRLQCTQIIVFFFHIRSICIKNPIYTSQQQLVIPGLNSPIKLFLHGLLRNFGKTRACSVEHNGGEKGGRLSQILQCWTRTLLELRETFREVACSVLRPCHYQLVQTKKLHLRTLFHSHSVIAIWMMRDTLSECLYLTIYATHLMSRCKFQASPSPRILERSHIQKASKSIPHFHPRLLQNGRKQGAQEHPQHGHSYHKHLRTNSKKQHGRS